MSRVTSLVIAIIVLGAFGGTLWFLYQKSQEKPVTFDTSTPTTTDIVKKTVATGALVPREEVEIKPRVSGILDKLYVEPGQAVKRGDLIADITIVPDMANLNRAESQVKSARIAFENAKRELARHKSLFEKNVISEAEVASRRVEHDLKKQELDTAISNLQIVKEGASRRAGKQANTKVRSTVEGMVLDVPVRVGSSVIESNNFNPGTTIALIADMGDMIFQGQVDESEVGKLHEGLKLAIKVGAIEGQVLEGSLEYISPKGTESEGVIQFEVKAAIKTQEGVFIRAGYSANADIVLERKDEVLAINERLLQFDEGKPYVEVEVGPQVFERRDVEVGLSDGIHIEILSGVDKDTKIKKPSSGDGGDGEKGKKRGRRR